MVGYNGPVAQQLDVSEGVAFTLFGPFVPGVVIRGVGANFCRGTGTVGTIGIDHFVGAFLFESGSRPALTIAAFNGGRPLLRGAPGPNSVLPCVSWFIGDLQSNPIWIPFHQVIVSPSWLGFCSDNGSGENAVGFVHFAHGVVGGDGPSIHRPGHGPKVA